MDFRDDQYFERRGDPHDQDMIRQGISDQQNGCRYVFRDHRHDMRTPGRFLQLGSFLPEQIAGRALGAFSAVLGAIGTGNSYFQDSIISALNARIAHLRAQRAGVCP